MSRLIVPSIHEIVFLRGSVNYTEFHMTNGRKIMSSYTLVYHQNLIEGFLRISKSYLVNPYYIEKINANGSQREILLKNGERIKVSRRRKKVLEGFQPEGKFLLF
ncbi:LytTR family DNA-binding domain-containing protein [Emticicia sp. BO119]|uniref:LytR/AlgR family response regulator transcription factor n=1 Tax=Emticicia sp. BO119 TaxID=2757768 RepID=UPI0015F0E6C9|nr:LytTR family DNA-binding domain-containing protein [Emticicia sp. BO119]MBA4850557.1 LytTR family transcriptional regulator DNA-binding domain-containing protein [Emticicia sp. BO119]